MCEEVKEMLKWNVDRLLFSNKIREFMEWMKDIMKDIVYQRYIFSNFIVICFIKGWLEIIFLKYVFSYFEIYFF